MNKNTIRNYLYNLITQLIIIITPIITIPYKTKIFSTVNIGIYSYVYTILSYILLMGNLGISLYGTREIAYVKDDPQKRSKIVYELITLKAVILISIALLFYLTIGIRSKYLLYLLIIIPDILFSIFDLTWFLQGLEKFDKISIVNSINRILSVIAVYIFLKKDSDLPKYIILTVVFDILPLIAILLLAKKYIVKIKKDDIHPTNHLKKSLLLFIPQVFIQVYTVFDKIMLSYFQSSISEVGYYDYANKLSQIVLTVISSLTIVILPELSYHFKNNNTKQMKASILDALNIVLLLAIPIIFGTIAISSELVLFLFGEKYIKIASILKILIISIYPIGITGIIAQYLITSKKELQFSRIVFIGMLVNLAFNGMLISTYNSIGVAIATIITEFIVLIEEIPIIKEIADIRLLLKTSLIYSVYGFIMYYIITSINISCLWIALSTKIIIGIIIYLTLLLATKDKNLNKILKLKLINKN